MKKIFHIITFLCLFSSNKTVAQTDLLRQKIQSILSTKNATVGVSIDGLETKDTLSLNNDKHFPMQSVFKFHIALAVLNEVDKGKFSLAQKIYIRKTDLVVKDMWSPIRDKYPNGNVYLSLAEILKYTISQSDNSGCDLLLRLIGGPKTVNDYIHKTGVKDVQIKATEEEAYKAWNVQFSNWTTPVAATQLLKTFYERKILSKKSYDFLWKMLLETSTGPDRIKGQLPPGTLVAHKTGSSGTNEQGITAATNDIGIITLPNGKHFIISVFVTNSKENSDTNEKIIADISKAAWDYFNKAD
jgi:beta-lactamase class A